MSDYLADVKRYDAGADAAPCKDRKHLGIAPEQGRLLVSCSDKSGTRPRARKMVYEKLGETDAAAADAVVRKGLRKMKETGRNSASLSTTWSHRRWASWAICNRATRNKK